MHTPSRKSTSIWSDSNFCKFTIIGGLESLGMGVIFAAFPLLVSEKFGSGDELIIAGSLLTLTRVIFAPVIGNFLLKKGPVRIVRVAMIGLASLFALQPLIDDYLFFQTTIILRAIIGMACDASLMTLQAWVIPKGKNVTANGIYLATSRSLCFSAPFLIKLLEGYCTITQCFYIASSLFLLSACLTFSLSSAANNAGDDEKKKETGGASYLSLFRLFKRKPILIRLFMPLFGSFIIRRVQTLFLLWSTLHTFHEPKTTYISLLTAYGFGNVVSSFLAPMLVQKITKRVNINTLYFLMRLSTIACLLALGWTPTVYGMMGLLLIVTLPESLANICFYTLLQKHLTKKEQSIIHTLTFPISLLFGLGGSLLAFTYTHHFLSLQRFWLLVGIISLSIALLPLLQKKKSSLAEITS